VKLVISWFINPIYLVWMYPGCMIDNLAEITMKIMGFIVTICHNYRSILLLGGLLGGREISSKGYTDWPRGGMSFCLDH